MSMAVSDTPEASSSGVADDWETGEAEQEEQLKSKQQQVRILKRAKEEREAEKAVETLTNLPTPPHFVPFTADSKPIPQTTAVKLLRRPASSSNVSNAKKEGDEDLKEKQKQTHEERRANYDAARSRILGSDYKPEEVKSPTQPACRSRSPEIISRATPLAPLPSLAPLPAHPSLTPDIPLPPVLNQVLVPPHLYASYHHMIMNAPYGTIGPYGASYSPLNGVAPSIPLPPHLISSTVPITQPQPFHVDVSTPPPPSRPPLYSNQSIPTPSPLSNLNSLMSSLPPVQQYNDAYGQQAVYGRPPPSMFSNPDISFRHVPSQSQSSKQRRN